MMQNKLTELYGLEMVVVIAGWLAGILLESWVSLPAFALLVGACAALLWLIPLWRDSQARLIMFIILWLLLGAWRFAIASPTGDAQAISAFIGTGKLEVQGTVADEPKLAGRSRLLLIAVSSVSKNGGTNWQDAHGQLEAQTLGGEIENPYGPNYGDNVELQGKLQAPTPHSSPAIFASMAFPRINVNSSGGNPIIAALYHIRTILATLISQSLPQPEAALLIALLLSLRTPALKPLIPFFNETGTAHLIAPSGFKVTVLAGLVATNTRWLYEKTDAQKIPMLPAQKFRANRRRWLATALTISSIAAYTILNGAGPAALRAGMMGILLVLAPRLGRIYNIYTGLALTALLMSLFDPFVLWDAGFQLSFIGTLGIVLFTPHFQRLLHPIERLPLGHFIAEISAVTLAAQIATLPILALDFNQVSFIAPIANILTVPLLGTVIFIGILLCGAGMLFAPLGILCGWVAWPVLWYIDHIVTWCAELPDAYIQVSSLNSGLAWCYYALLSLHSSVVLYKWPGKTQVHHVPPMLSRRTWRILQLSAVLLVILATGATELAARPGGQLTITFLNVAPANQASQGEAILLSTADGKTALIDGGLDATSLGQELDSRLPPWQRSLDFVILTSPKSDHLDGLQDVVSRYQVGEVLDAGMLHPNT
jgi:competence protein ComEC